MYQSPATRRTRYSASFAAVSAGLATLAFGATPTLAQTQITLLNVVDEFTHESIADTLARSLNADTPVAILESVIAVRGITPSFIRTEKGSELTAASLRERCRFTGTSYIKSGVPCKTCYI